MAGYLFMKKDIESSPTRQHGSTEASIREYAVLAKLDVAGMAEIEKLIKTLDSSVDRLRALIGKVSVTVKDGKHKGKIGNPRPRWFCNVVPSGAQDDAPPVPVKAGNRAERRAALAASNSVNSKVGDILPPMPETVVTPPVTT
jgi:hypothetical protein